MDEFLIRCNCRWIEHQVWLVDGARYSIDEPTLALEVHLRPGPFVVRLWRGIRYILGFRSRYGDFDEIVISVDTVKQMHGWLSQWLSVYDPDQW